jgi:hypothetical protein
MQAQQFSVVPGRTGAVPTWRLLDANGKQRAEMSYTGDVGLVVAALELSKILAANCARVGLLIECHARYQCAEDEFNEFGD